MNSVSTFQVYNASAGSGKTFTLVKEYLKILLQTEDVYAFQKILAITFTNKAAAEMKERVLENLQAISEGEATDILKIILLETSLDQKIATKRATIILKAILQNYSAFYITTIDSFTHKIIKSFAFDLGLNLNFEVEMDATTLLSKAVDVLISKIGVDASLTKVLIDFSIDKAADDKSWDIVKDLNSFAKLLLNEDEAKHFKRLSSTTLEDFLELKTKLKQQQKNIEQQAKELGEKGLALIDGQALKHNDFYYSLLPKHFVKLRTSIKSAAFFNNGSLKKRIEEELFYSKKTSAESISSIEFILPELLELYKQSEELYRLYTLNALILKNLIPLAVVSKINSELSQIKEDNNIRLNAEFNQLISDAIADEPAPFIYERIGQKFSNYFLDEMQDTSVLQWTNLIPLIHNSLAQESGSLLLVGDGKQAIYRWRGGRAEQFIALGSEQNSNAANPFQVPKTVEKLDTNRRSYSQIIDFTNEFFQHVAQYLQEPSYQHLFLDGNKQKTTDKKGGYVSIDFLETEEDKEEDDLKFAKRVHEIILTIDPSFSRNSICVLVRNKKNAITVANYLSEKDVRIVSSETLLLANSTKVNFLIDLLQIVEHPNDQSAKLKALYFLHKNLQLNTDPTLFYADLVHEENASFFAKLNDLGCLFDFVVFQQSSLYEKIEMLIRSFQLAPSSDAYLQFFLDVVFEQQQKRSSVQEFLNFWELKKDSLSIVAPSDEAAVQIMTIHKAKGLEFPIVIFPYDIDIYFQKEPKAWLQNLPGENFEGFDELLISASKDIQDINNEGAAIYQEQQTLLELDNFNLMYVAFTRPIEQLYIVANKKTASKGEVKLRSSAGLLINYLQETGHWSEDKLHYDFGQANRLSTVEKTKIKTQIQKRFISNSIAELPITILASSSILWDTVQGKAIAYGNLIHELLSKIKTHNDVDAVLQVYKQQGLLDQQNERLVKNQVLQIVNHSLLKKYYSAEVSVYNEREIVDTDGQIIIPDRLVFLSKNEVVLLDYKTGKPEKQHQQQLLRYEKVLSSMNLKTLKKVLVYIDSEILVEEF
ncbi:ATP-dependent helicase [Polaribacter pacificus]|uniref:DNA 3'-5' helicase n=1 Tax=Polaribacter pacificus TaxID=1775173 RepID=A0A917HXF8_9FLAO|nr:UvrD-helicase domain-containing protein [Polaribacter pacificus]GGG93836.1 ATP-dependent helicase [Polaribacter pacificus]